MKGGMKMESKYNIQITQWINDLFKNFKQSPELDEQKEELKSDLVDRILDYMKGSELSFEEAFEKCKDSLGNLEEFLEVFEEKGFERERIFEDDPFFANKRKNNGVYEEKIQKTNLSVLISLSPFVYLALGIWFGLWAWGWMVIPLSAIWLSNSESISDKIVSSSPFIYLLLGIFFGLWAWGWVIIPISAILLSNGSFFKFKINKY